jgi:hypothetical protein
MTSVKECQHDHQPFDHSTSSAKRSMEPRSEHKRLLNEATDMIVYGSLQSSAFSKLRYAPPSAMLTKRLCTSINSQQRASDAFISLKTSSWLQTTWHQLNDFTFETHDGAYHSSSGPDPMSAALCFTCKAPNITSRTARDPILISNCHA